MTRRKFACACPTHPCAHSNPPFLRENAVCISTKPDSDVVFCLPASANTTKLTRSRTRDCVFIMRQVLYRSCGYFFSGHEGIITVSKFITVHGKPIHPCLFYLIRRRFEPNVQIYEFFMLFFFLSGLMYFDPKQKPPCSGF